MGLGVQILNTDVQTITIDSNYANLALREKGTFTTGGATDFSRSGLTSPVIAIAGSTFAYGYCYPVNPGQFAFNIQSFAASGTAIPYYIFDVPQNTAHNFGMQIFDASARKTYDLLDLYMRVRDVRSIGARADADFTYDVGRKYAVMMIDAGFNQDPMAGNAMVLYAYTTNNVVSVRGEPIRDTEGSPDRFDYGAQFMVIDVTNY